MEHDNTRTFRLLEVLEQSVANARFNSLDKTHIEYWRVIINELEKESQPVSKGE